MIGHLSDSFANAYWLNAFHPHPQKTQVHRFFDAPHIPKTSRAEPAWICLALSLNRISPGNNIIANKYHWVSSPQQKNDARRSYIHRSRTTGSFSWHNPTNPDIAIERKFISHPHPICIFIVYRHNPPFAFRLLAGGLQLRYTLPGKYI